MVVNGFRLVHDTPLRQSELDCIYMLRAISGGVVPGTTLKAVQALRMALNDSSTRGYP